MFTLPAKTRLLRGLCGNGSPVRLEESVIWLAPPEYVIIGKLEFYREGASEKHLRDIRGMLAITDVDRALLEKEIAQRGLADVWRKLI
jgi:hypothetical protein